jgi:putative transposase
MCESFFAPPESDLLARRKFQTKAEASMPIFDLSEGWYNPARRHLTFAYQSPIGCEWSQAERLESADM